MEPPGRFRRVRAGVYRWYRRHGLWRARGAARQSPAAAAGSVDAGTGGTHQCAGKGQDGFRHLCREAGKGPIAPHCQYRVCRRRSAADGGSGRWQRGRRGGQARSGRAAGAARQPNAAHHRSQRCRAAVTPRFPAAAQPKPGGRGHRQGAEEAALEAGPRHFLRHHSAGRRRGGRLLGLLRDQQRNAIRLHRHGNQRHAARAAQSLGL